MVAVGGQARAKGAFGGCLTLKLAVNTELMWGTCILAMKNGQKIRTKRPETDMKLIFLMSRTQKLKGLYAASLGLETFNDNP